MIHLNTHNMQYPSCIDLHIVYQICFSHHIILYHIQIYYIQISPLKLALEVGGSHFAPNLVQNENHHHKQKQKLVQNGIPHHWTPKKVMNRMAAHPHVGSSPPCGFGTCYQGVQNTAQDLLKLPQVFRGPPQPHPTTICLKRTFLQKNAQHNWNQINERRWLFLSLGSDICVNVWDRALDCCILARVLPNAHGTS